MSTVPDPATIWTGPPAELERAAKHAGLLN
jgi:hypothetical protein